ncbi:MAG TPA: 3-isopropylmalate dehydratase [Dehalococcoidia bacterium]|nr:3-isopropylmalate dehydratase [Dehalococcoidia bacterium]
MGARKMRGEGWTFDGILDVDWQICSFALLRELRASGVAITDEELGKYCMVNVDPEFPKKVKAGDFIVAGDNMGYGHDHDHACRSIKGAGVAAVLCDSTNGNFMRNCLDHGLPIIEYPGIRAATKQGDTLEVDLETGTITNITREKVFHFRPFPAFLIESIEDGGTYPHLKKEVAAGKYR